MAIQISQITQFIRQRIMDNLPPNLSPEAVRFYNIEIDQPNDKHWMNVLITWDERERRTVGVREFQFSGEITMRLQSPNGEGTVEHENILDAMRFLFDDVDLNTGNGVIRFDAAFLQTIGDFNNYFGTNIVCPFTINEFTQ